MGKSILFVHGAWVTELCWGPFISYFTAAGYACLAPPWPYKDRPVAQLRENPSPGLARLGIGEIVNHYAAIISGQPEPPVLIGHSFGGLFVQMLLDRGLGAAGVAINSAPPKGVLPLRYPSVLRANLGVLLVPGGWRKVVRMSFREFQYAFVNCLPEAEQRAAYDRYVVPESGRIFFQAAFASVNVASRVDFRNSRRPPLLLIAGLEDHIVPAHMNRVNLARYSTSGAVTDFKEFANRCHWTIAQPGWEDVAGYIARWLEELPGRHT